MAEAIKKSIDEQQNSDSFCWKSGGDGNGEQLMYLLDVYFEELDNKES